MSRLLKHAAPVVAVAALAIATMQFTSPGEGLSSAQASRNSISPAELTRGVGPLPVTYIENYM